LSRLRRFGLIWWLLRARQLEEMGRLGGAAFIGYSELTLVTDQYMDCCGLKTDGDLTKGPEEIVDRWYEHFKNLLNIQSICYEDVIAAVPTLPPLLHFGKPPTMEELEATSSQLKVRKAGGLSGFLPEYILLGGAILRDKLLALMRDVWNKGEVFDAWRDALIIPVPKKGNL